MGEGLLRARIPSFKPKSNWIPKVTNPVLDLFLRTLEEEVSSVKEQGQS